MGLYCPLSVAICLTFWGHGGSQLAALAARVPSVFHLRDRDVQFANFISDSGDMHIDLSSHRPAAAS